MTKKKKTRERERRKETVPSPFFFASHRRGRLSVGGVRPLLLQRFHALLQRAVCRGTEHHDEQHADQPRRKDDVENGAGHGS